MRIKWASQPGKEPIDLSTKVSLNFSVIFFTLYYTPAVVSAYPKTCEISYCTIGRLRILLAIAAKCVTNNGENETIFFARTSQLNSIQFPEKRGIE